MNTLKSLENLLKLSNEQLKKRGYRREELIKSYGIVKYYVENLTCRQAFMLHYLHNSEPEDEMKFFKIIKANYYLIKYLHILDKNIDLHSPDFDVNLDHF